MVRQWRWRVQLNWPRGGFRSQGPSPRRMLTMADRHLTSGTTGSLLHAAARYDLRVWLVTLGRERVFREQVVRLARLQPGESVLDVDCGTGSLTIAATRRVGPTGTLSGIDASPERLARAGQKARKAGVAVVFNHAVAEALPFPDAHVDAVLTTLRRHHQDVLARFASRKKRVPGFSDT